MKEFEFVSLRFCCANENCDAPCRLAAAFWSAADDVAVEGPRKAGGFIEVLDELFNEFVIDIFMEGGGGSPAASPVLPGRLLIDP